MKPSTSPSILPSPSRPLPPPLISLGKSFTSPKLSLLSHSLNTQKVASELTTSPSKMELSVPLPLPLPIPIPISSSLPSPSSSVPSSSSSSSSSSASSRSENTIRASSPTDDLDNDNEYGFTPSISSTLQSPQKHFASFQRKNHQEKKSSAGANQNHKIQSPNDENRNLNNNRMGDENTPKQSSSSSSSLFSSSSSPHKRIKSSHGVPSSSLPTSTSSSSISSSFPSHVSSSTPSSSPSSPTTSPSRSIFSSQISSSPKRISTSPSAVKLFDKFSKVYTGKGNSMGMGNGKENYYFNNNNNNNLNSNSLREKFLSPTKPNKMFSSHVISTPIQSNAANSHIPSSISSAFSSSTTPSSYSEYPSSLSPSKEIRSEISRSTLNNSSSYYPLSMVKKTVDEMNAEEDGMDNGSDNHNGNDEMKGDDKVTRKRKLFDGEESLSPSTPIDTHSNPSGAQAQSTQFSPLAMVPFPYNISPAFLSPAESLQDQMEKEATKISTLTSQQQIRMM